MIYLQKCGSGTTLQPGVSKISWMSLFAVFIIGCAAKPVAVTAEENTVVVSLGDLDLATDAGLQKARDRLHQTARLLCLRMLPPWSVAHQPDFVHCVDDATAAAVTKLETSSFVAAARAHAKVRAHL